MLTIQHFRCDNQLFNRSIKEEVIDKIVIVFTLHYNLLWNSMILFLWINIFNKLFSNL